MILNRTILRLCFALFIFSNPLSSNELKATGPIGKGLYIQKGSNSCIFCHGLAGNNGSLKDAADLTKPRTWKVFKALGGEKSLAANKSQFLTQMEQASVHLIKSGAVGHNKKTFVKDWFNWDLAGSFNSQMLGVRGGPSSKWIKKYKKRGMNRDIASLAVYKYIQTLDSQSLFIKPPMTK